MEKVKTMIQIDIKVDQMLGRMKQAEYELRGDKDITKSKIIELAVRELYYKRYADGLD